MLLPRLLAIRTAQCRAEPECLSFYIGKYSTDREGECHPSYRTTDTATSPMYQFKDSFYFERLAVQTCGVCECASHALLNTTTAICTNLNLSSIPAELTSLNALYLDNNAIQAISASQLAGFSSLEHLVLDNNAITHIEAEAWVGVAALKILSLADNLLTEGAISGLLPTSLEELVLSGNPFTQLTGAMFAGLTQLRTLGLDNMGLVRYALRSTSGCLFSLAHPSPFPKYLPSPYFLAVPPFFTVSNR